MFIKKFYFVSEKYKQRVCREKIGREEDVF